MKNLNFLSFLLSLVMISFFSSCTSVKYGAHFQAGNNQSRIYEKQAVAEVAEYDVEQNKNVVNTNETASIAPVAENKDASAAMASVASVKVAAETPKAEEITKRQEEVIKEVRERVQNMSRKEKRELRREVRKIRLADYVKNLPAYENTGVEDLKQNEVNIVALIFAILLPPLGVFLHQGEINTKFWISLVLTLLGYVPGQIYAVLLVLGVI